MRRVPSPGLAPRVRPFSLAVLVGLLLVVLPGCGQGSFLGNRYNNFRAYYNTFYNARQSFEQGEEQLIRVDQRVDRSRFLPVFAARQNETTQTSGPFQDAIDKSADLLRERPDSKWADDALLLIGKAYFYQGNYVGAEDKFRETVETAEGGGQAEVADEARFWLGRTLAASERFEEATGVLTEGLAREGLRPYWRARLQLALGEMYVQQRRWDDAAEALQAGVEELRDNDVAGRAQFLLGQVYEAAGAYDEAAEAYAAV
ncbi:MAG: tetratricopeptide repeat protein, partial [Rhodothermaceae bacterium]|nr:tetratricopeptide repeat protein [Rhodothermaceae bacterium]